MKFKLPKIGKDKNSLVMLGLGIFGAASLYLILVNRKTGYDVYDNLLQGVGGATRLTGRGQGVIPDVIPPDKVVATSKDQAAVKQAAYSEWYQTPVSDDDRLSVA